MGFTTIECDGEPRTVMWNYLGKGRLFFGAQVSIAPVDKLITEHLKEGEAPIFDEDYLIIDYSKNFSDYCPQIFSAVGPRNTALDLSQWNNLYPIKNIVDIAKITGKTTTEDGKEMALMSGRSMYQDWLTEEWTTLAYFHLMVPDSSVVGVDHISVKNDFHFVEYGFWANWDATVPFPTKLLRGPNKKQTKQRIESLTKDLLGIYDPNEPGLALTSTPPYIGFIKAVELMKKADFKPPSPLTSMISFLNYLKGTDDFYPM